MNKRVLNQLFYFKRINVPKFIESNIQMIALKHLDLSDMGKLRDRTEGQSYYNRLRLDILAEYAFENIIGRRNFDWDKRSFKNYNRKKYLFDNKELHLIPFENDKLPKLNIDDVKNTIFVYVNIDNRVLLSKLATKAYLSEIINRSNSTIIEIDDFRNLIDFSSLQELVSNME